MNQGQPQTSQPTSRSSSSSAAFLHRLHTNPSSHHITLSGSHHGANTNTSSPQSINVPLEPTVAETNKPIAASPSRAPDIVLSPEIPSQPVAGPSSLSSTTSLGRNPSTKRGRPKTAPGRKESNTSPTTTFPVMPRESDMTASPERAPLTGEQLATIAASDNACLASFAQNEVSDMSEAMGMLSVASGANGGKRARAGTEDRKVTLLGKAGTLMASSSTSEALGGGVGSQAGSPLASMDWQTFAHAYAHGLFDPNKIPNPPSSGETPSGGVHSAHSSPGKRYSSTLPAPSNSAGTDTSSSGYSSKSSGGSTMTSVSSAPSTSASSAQPGSMAAAMAARKKAYEMEHLPDRAHVQMDGGLRPDKLSLPSYSLAAATVRMASSGFRESDFAPLAMPSPERELLDPLASVVSPDSASTLRDSASSDPGSSRFPLHRSMSSAVTNNAFNNLRLPTIQASPVSTPNEPHGKGKVVTMEGVKSPHRAHLGLVNSRIPPASAPLEKTVEAEVTTDYFGNASPRAAAAATPASSTSTADSPTPRLSSSLPDSSKTPDPVKPKNTPPRHSSETLPSLAYPQDIGPLFDKLGWLPAPVPPDEIARRRALYRFNILHTAADLNFDRIAHMAKLVFSPKIVLIALTDSETQWHKAQSGLGAEEAARISSFCSHTVLARSDEPFVVLDTKLDWRFEKNPQVVGPPGIRFYAGAPLRTADGHSIGSLCIIDDKPRLDFPPRSRLILKEFAAVAMREMELWRDKLQLRVRDKIQTSMEKFTRECLEMDAKSSASNAEAAAKMDVVYSRAAQLVCSTLDLDGCFILDISQIEMTQVDTPTGKSTIYRADPYGTEHQSPVLERSDSFGPVNAFPVLATTPTSTPTRPLTAYEHEKLSGFLRDHRDGRIFESVAPHWIRYMFPQAFRYGMVVPIYGVDQQPFVMICAYTTNKAKQFLEGYELQFLRAIGVIILSAVLRRRMVLADKTKSVLISSVSHELRTPLHGILAAAELLSDTQLDSNQLSFLKTVQTCGNSLIETVNHVLDFTKLSGGGSGKANSSKLGKVNLAALVEQTVEGCWIGQRARFFMGDADIGSFYAPPTTSGLVPKSQRAQVGERLAHVETVIDIDQRERGWNVRCEKGGLRRVLMNLVGNSFKFTKDGYVQITLREMSHPPGSKTIPVEMAVIDTGKGIGKDFLKDQLFHPFSQENPLQTGTGLGLAIVNSIVRSESVNGKVDVWSAEGMGTEIRVTFEVEVVDDEDDASSTSSVIFSTTSSFAFGTGHTVSFVAFHPEHRGHQLSLEVLHMYTNAWTFGISPEDSQTLGDIVVINEEEEVIPELYNQDRALILLVAVRGFDANHISHEINSNGGFCHLLFKPVGPTVYHNALQAAVDWLHAKNGSVDGHGSSSGSIDNERPPISRGSSGASQESASTISELSHRRFTPLRDHRLPLQRRRSEENEQIATRPSMAPRGITYHAPRRVPSVTGGDETPQSSPQQGSASPTSTISTISLADGGVMLKAATVPAETPRRGRMARVMVVEDNIINRRVLGAFLKKRGFEYAEAVDGRAGVELFDSTPANYWDVILMDISMPVMNGHDATRAIRQIEASRRSAPPSEIPVVPPPGKPVTIPPTKVVQARAKIFALTGLATQDDKREAFGSGVDGYLVKPVSLSSLDTIFKKIGF